MRLEHQLSDLEPAVAIKALLAPRAIAVVGATPDTRKPGGRFLTHLGKYGFPGKIFPVNPKYTSADGVKYYADLRSLPEPADLAALLVPAGAVPAYLLQAAEVGIRAAMILSSGFAEAGADGQTLQSEIIKIARDTGLAVLGPNCLGIVDLDRNLVASFSNAFEGARSFERGDIAFVSQSGALGAAVFIQAQAEQVGVGRFISTGNEAVLDLSDFIEYLTRDSGISTILGYIEGLRDGARFVRAARAARAAGKSVAVIKVGKSDAGANAARTHTGAIVSGPAVYGAAFRRAGVFEAQDVQELLDLAVALPERVPVRGNRVGIVSSSGGAAVVMADACSVHGLEVRRFGDATLARLSAILPSFAGYANPVDYGPVYGNPDVIEASMHAAAADPDIDVILFFLALSPGMLGVIEPRISRVQERSGKPVIAVWMAGPEGAVRSLRKHGITAFDDVSRAARVLSQLARTNTCPHTVEIPNTDLARRHATREILAKALAQGRTSLSERETKALLVPYGLSVTRDIAVSSAEQAEIAVRALAGPAVIKAEDANLLHKSDAGAVRLNVSADSARADYAAVIQGASAYLKRPITDAVVQPMVRPGFEMLLGLRCDPQFGPTVSVGFGGVTTEVLADVVTELVPVDRRIALSMLDRLSGARLLDEFRGRPALDRSALAGALVALSTFALDVGSMIEELDLNPVIVHPSDEGCVIVDAAAIFSRNGSDDQNAG